MFTERDAVEALKLECPYCKAKPKQPCLGANNQPRQTVHGARLFEVRDNKKVAC